MKVLGQTLVELIIHQPLLLILRPAPLEDRAGSLFLQVHACVVGKKRGLAWLVLR
jgi:hypothetical protein